MLDYMALLGWAVVLVIALVLFVGLVGLIKGTTIAAAQILWDMGLKVMGVKNPSSPAAASPSAPGVAKPTSQPTAAPAVAPAPPPAPKKPRPVPRPPTRGGISKSQRQARLEAVFGSGELPVSDSPVAPNE